jgi:pimeloyl-ACP methyl ester carboxylesterase
MRSYGIAPRSTEGTILKDVTAATGREDAQADLAAASWAGAGYKIYDDAGHAVHIEKPNEINRDLK